MSRMKYLGIFSRDIFWKERNIVNTYIYLNKRRILIKGSDVTRVYACTLNLDQWRHLETIKISIGNKYITHLCNGITVIYFIHCPGYLINI